MSQVFQIIFLKLKSDPLKFHLLSFCNLVTQVFFNLFLLPEFTQNSSKSDDKHEQEFNLRKISRFTFFLFPFSCEKKKKKELQERRPPQASVHLSSFLLHPLKLKSFAPFRWSNYNFISGQPTRLDPPLFSPLESDAPSLAADRDAPFLPRPFNVFISSPWSRIRKEKLGKNSTHPFLHAVVSWLLWFMEEVAFVADYFFFFPPRIFLHPLPVETTEPRIIRIFINRNSLRSKPSNFNFRNFTLSQVLNTSNVCICVYVYIVMHKLFTKGKIKEKNIGHQGGSNQVCFRWNY